MLKKVMSGALSVLMLSSCMGGNVKADPRTPRGEHICQLRAMAKCVEWHDLKIVNGRKVYMFNREAFNRFHISYFALHENRDLGVQLINQLFEAEIKDTYLETYNKLMKQYKENEQVQLALEEINEFLESCNNITIQDNDFGYGSFVGVRTEFKEKLINMDSVLRRDILRLETLRSLYRLIISPSSLTSNGSLLCSFFIPWLGEVDMSSSNYGSLVSCLLLIDFRRELPICGCKEKSIDSIRNIEKFISTLKVEKQLPCIRDGLSIEKFGGMISLLNCVSKLNKQMLDDLMIRIIG